MKITVTGHKGFIGSHYYNYVKETSEVFPYDQKDGNIKNLRYSGVTSSMPDCDVVVHLAATNGTRLFYEQPTDVFVKWYSKFKRHCAIATHCAMK